MRKNGERRPVFHYVEPTSLPCTAGYHKTHDLSSSVSAGSAPLKDRVLSVPASEIIECISSDVAATAYAHSIAQIRLSVGGIWTSSGHEVDMQGSALSEMVQRVA